MERFVQTLSCAFRRHRIDVRIVATARQKKNYQMQSSNTMQNIGGIPLGQNKSVQIVRIGDRLLVVGVGENIALLDEIRDEDEIERILNQKDEQTSSADWLQKLKSMKRTPEKDINIYDTLNDHLEDVDREKNERC